MKLVADFHVHTIASGHAYSTVLENARAASQLEVPARNNIWGQGSQRG